jgi:hypothetical protein
VLRALCGPADWPVGRLRLVGLGGVDRGLAGRIAPDVAQLMPHGGPRVVQRLAARLETLGVAALDDDRGPDPAALYPEAADRLEALALAAVAGAESPLAVALLLDQPRRWRTRPVPTAADRARGRRLDRLCRPALVALAGAANVGKSTLSNALLGRSMSIALDRPGTTRDYTSGRIDLAGLVVDWHDTPGLRPTDDPVEREAMEIAVRLLDRAELVVALADAGHDWPDLGRSPDLRVASKADLAPRPDADLAVSATTGAGLAELVRAVRDALVPPEDLAHPGPWPFDPRLEITRP